MCSSNNYNYQTLKNFGRPIKLTEGFVETGDLIQLLTVFHRHVELYGFMINQPLLLVIDVDAKSSSMRDDESFHIYVALALSSRQFGPPRECDDENFHFYGVLITVLLITTRTLDRDRPSRGPGRKAFGYMKHKQKFSWIIRNEYSDWIWPIIVAQDRLREPDTRTTN